MRYKLSDEEREMLSWALVGLIPSALRDDLEKIKAGKLPNPVPRTPLLLVDDRFDGKEDRSEEIAFVLDHPINILFSACAQRYGDPFGLILAGFIFIGAGAKMRMADLMRMHPDVDFGGPIKRPSAKERVDNARKTASVEAT